jgi:hypothetical protein
VPSQPQKQHSHVESVMSVSTVPVTFRLTVDDENCAEIFWDALRASNIVTPGNHEPIETALDTDGFVFVDEPTLEAIKAFDGWSDGPDYAPTALTVERIEGEAALRSVSDMREEDVIRLQEALRAAGAAQTWGHSSLEAWQILTNAERDLCAKEMNGEDFGSARPTILTGLWMLSR